MPKPKLNADINQFSTLFTWQKISKENIDEELSFADTKKFLNSFDIHIGKKKEVLTNFTGRDSDILYWYNENDLIPGLIYFYVFFL